MNYSTFYEFVLLAEVENYAEVAEQLFISESTLARHIRMMEAEIGVSLFDRTAKGIRLNKYGKALLPYAREAVDIWDNCIDEIDEKKQRDMNEISILCGYNVVKQLIDFHKKEDSVVFSVMDEYNDNRLILERLQEGQFSFAVTCLPQELPEDISAVPIQKFSYRVLVPADHPFADGGSVPIKALESEMLIDTYKKETTTDVLLQSHFQKHGVNPAVHKYRVNMPQITQAIEEGEGICIRRWIQDDRDFGTLLAIPMEPDLEISVCLCWLKDRVLRPIEKKFIEFMKKSK